VLGTGRATAGTTATTVRLHYSLPRRAAAIVFGIGLRDDRPARRFKSDDSDRRLPLRHAAARRPWLLLAPIAAAAVVVFGLAFGVIPLRQPVSPLPSLGEVVADTTTATTAPVPTTGPDAEENALAQLHWITVVSQRFSTTATANAWCDSENIGPSDCLAARLTHDPHLHGNTVTR
jgi:hypothetical protein